jgi:cytochrome c
MRTKFHFFIKKISLLMYLLLLFALCMFSCNNKPEQKNTRKKIDYIKQIPGSNDSIPAEAAQKGEILIAYSDCYTCHKKEQRSAGPAFKDIAKRYPANAAYSTMLAQRIIIRLGRCSPKNNTPWFLPPTT